MQSSPQCNVTVHSMPKLIQEWPQSYCDNREGTLLYSQINIALYATRI